MSSVRWTAPSHGSPRKNADFLLHPSSFCLQKMTLGRSASGAIKIKTDTEGGGLRAVGCACCGGGSCGCLTTPSAVLIPILDAATYATCNGLPPTNWSFVSLPGPPGWYAEWFYSTIHTLRWFSETKCLYLSGDNAMNIFRSGGIECCDLPPCFSGNFTINGESYPFHSLMYDSMFPITPPSFVF